MPSRSNGKRQFHINPLHILAQAANTYSNPSLIPTEALLATWQHLYRHLHLWHQDYYGHAHRAKSVHYHWLMSTSAHGFHNVNGIACDALREVLLQHLSRTFKALAFAQDKEIRSFATFLGFQQLDHDLLITSRQPAELPTWIEHVYGIRLKESPNEYHPGAIWTHGADLQLNGYTRRAPYWTLRIEYSYRDESSSWGLKWHQKRGETLEAMLARAQKDFFALVDWGKSHPCVDTLRWRSIEHRTRRRITEALGTAFCDHYRLGNWEPPLADLCMEQSNVGVFAHKIHLTKARLRTLTSWAKDSLAKHPKTPR